MNGDRASVTSPVVDCLVVDDEPRLRQVLVHLMRNDGFQCFEAGNGLEAIEILQRQPVTLILSELVDQMMLRGRE